MKYLLIILALFIASCSNQPAPSTEKPATAMKFGAEGAKQNPTIVENGTLDTLETVTVTLSKTGTYTYNTDTCYVIRHKYVKPGTPPVDPPPTTGTRQNLIFENDGSSFTGFTLANHQFCCDDKSITIQASPDGQGKAIKFVLNKTDAVVSGSRRSEIQFSNGDISGTEGERWYGMKYWLQTYDKDQGAESILQWHDGAGPCPPQSIQIQSGSFRWQQCRPYPDGSGSTTNSFNTGTDMGATVTGKWITFVIHIKWSAKATGIIEVWKDGKQYVNQKNIVTNSPSGNYAKIGVNKWSWYTGGGTSDISTPRIFYIKDFREGNEKATYNDVTP